MFLLLLFLLNIFFTGDPGLGKSQMLMAINNISPRGVYVCGSHSTTTGLTVKLMKETGSGDYSLEAGMCSSFFSLSSILTPLLLLFYNTYSLQVPWCSATVGVAVLMNLIKCPPNIRLCLKRWSSRFSFVSCTHFFLFFTFFLLSLFDFLSYFLFYKETNFFFSLSV